MHLSSSSFCCRFVHRVDFLCIQFLHDRPLILHSWSYHSFLQGKTLLHIVNVRLKVYAYWSLEGRQVGVGDLGLEAEENLLLKLRVGAYIGVVDGGKAVPPPPLSYDKWQR